MSSEENKSLARYYVEQVLNEGNLNALDNLVSPNYKRHLSPTAPSLTLEAQSSDWLVCGPHSRMSMSQLTT
jgi:hypothetical protein